MPYKGNAGDPNRSCQRIDLVTDRKEERIVFYDKQRKTKEKRTEIIKRKEIKERIKKQKITKKIF